MKKILLVDDESIARDRMKRFLRSFPDPIEIFEAENGPEALEQIKMHNPDVLFLDIQMPVMTGFDVLFQIEKRNFQVVFQTAYDEFAIRAFEANACGYLLKPYTEENFHKALNKALTLREQDLKLQELEKHLEKEKLYLKTLSVKTGTTTKILSVADILYFKSEDHYTFAITKESETILELSLNWLSERLDPKVFFRSHRATLLRLDQVKAVHESEVELISGVSLPLSRENKKKLLERLT